MEMEDRLIYAVITGDFIRFSDLDTDIRQSMPKVMEGAGRRLCAIIPGIMPYGLAVFRGDSWQALIADPVYSLRAAVFIRAYIRSCSGWQGLDTRMAIGVGPVDYVYENQVAAGDGPAFRRSGKMLEKTASSRNAGLLRYCFPEGQDESLIDALVRSVGALTHDWSPAQARAVAGILQGLKQAEIAYCWPAPVSRQVISKHLKNAHWPTVFHALEVFEQVHKATL